MSQAALDAYLDCGEGYPDCPACGDNSYVYPAIVTVLDTGEEFRDTLLSCELCRDPTFFFVDDDGSVFEQTPSCPCCGSAYTHIVPKQEPAIADESTIYSCDDCPAVFWLDDGELVTS